jgi:calcium-dependent protein kinase
LKEIFKMMDTDNSGAITFDELKVGLERLGSGLADSEIRSIMEAVSVQEQCTSQFTGFMVFSAHILSPLLCWRLVLLAFGF